MLEGNIVLDNFRIRLSGLGPVALRVALGTAFMFHGWGKFSMLIAGKIPMVSKIAGWPFVAWVDSVAPGLHFANCLGTAAGVTEFVGGIFVLVGLLTRFWAAGLVIQMAVAIATSHWWMGFSAMNGGYESPFTLGMMALGLFLLGPGPLSLDYLVGKLLRGPNANSVVGCGAKRSTPAAEVSPGDKPASQLQ